MAKEDLTVLQESLETAAKGLSKLTAKKMFGCHALWTNDHVFALVWKHGRIGVKLPDDQVYESLMGIKGAEPWKAGTRTMAHWVLVPESYHARSADLKKWVTKAHALCAKLEKKPKKGK